MADQLQARIEHIFLAAQALEGEAREELLRRECGAESRLREQVDSLLRAAENSEAFFDEFTGRLGIAAVLATERHSASAASPDEATPGDQVGAYTLVSRIASGGMGSVWCAERSDGRFKGRVAPGFEQTSYQIDRETATLVGPSFALATVSSIETQLIDIQGLSGPKDFEVPLRLPPGVTSARPAKVKVRVLVRRVPSPPATPAPAGGNP